uniref:Homeodomain mating-type protein n=1 Tax=Coprinellus disseminatus TaxID=71703 RepID=Q1WMP5_COPDI|nr:homeodomain mating-type protein [Coprinellus disseminatus]
MASTPSILQSIISTTRSLKNHIRDIGYRPKALPKSTRASQTPTTPSPIDLPYPQDVVENIRNFGISVDIQDRIVARVDQWYYEIRRTLEDQYSKTFTSLAALPHISGIAPEQDLPAVYETMYKDNLSPKFRADIDALLRQAINQRVTRRTEKQKIPFNHESLPLLETYFEYNAYPSAQDRALLAKKSLMCPRQIEVWFQNHRRRTKKEGRRLRRLSQDPLPHGLDFGHLNASMPQLLVPEEETKAAPLNESSPIPVVIPVRLHSQHSPAPAATHADNALCAPAPTRAFLTKYPPTPDHVSCLCSGKTWSFPAPEWPRRASGKAPTRKATITPDDLAVEFQKKLSITGSDGVKRTQDQLTAPAWYPFTTTLQPAPHFALIWKPTSTSSPPAPTPFAQLNPTPRDPHPLRQKTSNLTNYKRPTPYQPRQPPKTKPLSRATSNSSLSSISSISSDESEIIWTPSPSPFARYISLPKEDFAPRYPDWEAYLVPP